MTKTISLTNSDSTEEIKWFYSTVNLDPQKLIIFTSDKVAVMLGKQNRVAKSWQNYSE